MKRLSLLALLLLAGCHRSCEWKHPKPAEVTSYGYGEIKAAPDIARFTLEVAFTRNTMKDAVTETQKAMTEVTEAAGKTVSDSGDIRTTRISANKDFEWVNGANVFKGYSAGQSVEITLRDLSKMETLTEALLNTRVSAINDLEFSRSDMDSLREEANVLAMRDAKKNVQDMCRSVDLSCEELVSASTVAAPDQVPVIQNSPRMMMAKAAPQGISVKPGLMTFSAAVEATYRTK